MLSVLQFQIINLLQLKKRDMGKTRFNICLLATLKGNSILREKKIWRDYDWQFSRNEGILNPEIEEPVWRT